MFYYQWYLEGQGLSLVIEDDDRVSYAYLLSGDTVLSDVWLYNVVDPTELPEWSSPNDMPFLNPRCLSKDSGKFLPIDDEKRVRIEVLQSPDNPSIRVFIDEQLHAVLKNGAKPGWCRLAAANGALAKCIQEVEGFNSEQ